MPAIHFKQGFGSGGDNRLGTLCNAPKTGSLVTGDRIVSGAERGILKSLLEIGPYLTIYLKTALLLCSLFNEISLETKE